MRLHVDAMAEIPASSLTVSGTYMGRVDVYVFTVPSRLHRSIVSAFKHVY